MFFLHRHSAKQVSQHGAAQKKIDHERHAMKFQILVFFLHRRSHRRADMPECLQLYLPKQPPIALSFAALRTRMHDLWFTDSATGHGNARTLLTGCRGFLKSVRKNCKTIFVYSYAEQVGNFNGWTPSFSSFLACSSFSAPGMAVLFCV